MVSYLEVRIVTKLVDRLLQLNISEKYSIKKLQSDLKVDIDLLRNILTKLEKSNILKIEGDQIWLTCTKVELITSILLLGYILDLEKISRRLSWLEFEEFIKNIMRKFSYRVIHKVRIPVENTRVEIDLVAVKKDHILMIDAKRYIKSRLKIEYINDFTYKVKLLCEKYAREVIRRVGISTMLTPYEVYPAIITVHEHYIHNVDIPIVPVWKIRDFLEKFEGIKHLFTKFYITSS